MYCLNACKQILSCLPYCEECLISDNFVSFVYHRFPLHFCLSKKDVTGCERYARLAGSGDGHGSVGSLESWHWRFLPANATINYEWECQWWVEIPSLPSLSPRQQWISSSCWNSENAINI